MTAIATRARGLVPVTAATAAALLLASAPATAATPIPGEGSTTLAPFRGAPAVPKPIGGVPPTPQNPFMARNGDSNVHNDAWMTDAYTRSGPLGRSPSVFSAVLGNRVCITITFDTRGRIVASCVSATTGPRLYMLSPRTLDTVAELALPYKPPAAGIPPQLNTAGGVYFYLDNRDRAVLATTDRRIWVVEETGGAAHPGFRKVRDYAVGRYLKGDERLPSTLPDWQGRLWFVGRQSGTVGVLNPRTGRARTLRLREEIENSFATAREGVYIVSDKRMYRMEADRRGAPRIVWSSRYDNSGIHKPGQIDAGSGTTPTVMTGGYVAITDNADPMQVVVYRRAAKLRRGQRRVVCEVPVFTKGSSATENSLIAVGDSLIAENNYGYQLGVTAGGKLTAPGMARVDVRPGGRGCRLVWTNRTVRAPSVVPKASLRNGLVYTFTKDGDPGSPTADVWSWAALDFRTGRLVWQRLAGTGGGFNNHYAGIALGPDGRTAYLGGVGGVMALRDGGS
ncbi:MAG: hypothetical protein U0T02_04030 [Solirubrobacteraceae bacterium]